MSSSLESRTTAEPIDALGDNSSTKGSIIKSSRANASCSVHFSSQSAEAQRRLAYFSKIQNVLSHPDMADSSAAFQVDQTFRDVFQLKRGSYADLPPEKISEMMKSKALDNAPTQSLLSVVNGILEEGVERRNGEIPPRVACLLRKVVQEIERRIATQADHLRTQNNLFKAREEKFQSRIKVLEALASETTEVSEVSTNQVQQLKIEKTGVEHKKADEENINRLVKEQNQKNMEISRLKQEMETIKARYEEDFSKLMKEQDQKNIEISRLKQKMETMETIYEQDRMMVHEEDANRLMKEEDQKNMEISRVKQEMETLKSRYEGDLSKLTKEQDQKNMEISRLKQEMETMKSAYDEYRKKANGEVSNSLMKEEDQPTIEISRVKQEMGTLKSRYEGDVSKLMKEQDQKNMEISRLKQEMETMKNTYEEDMKKANGEVANRLMKEEDQKNMEISRVMQEMETLKSRYEGDVSKLMKEQDQKNMEISRLKQEIETTKSTYEEDMKKANGEVADRLIKEEDQKNMEISRVKQEMETMKSKYEGDISKLMKEQDQKNMEISSLKQEMKTMKNTYEEDMKKANGEVANRLMKEEDQKHMEISRVKQEMETMKSRYEGDVSKLMKEQDQKNMEISSLKREKESTKSRYEGDVSELMKEQDQKNMEISSLKQEMETMKSTYELRCSKLETEAKAEIEHKSQEYEHLLKDLRHKVKQVEASFESECQKWNVKQNYLHNSLDFQFSIVQKLKLSWKSVQQDVMHEKRVYSDECNKLGLSLQPLVKAAENHHAVLAENRKLFNEIQELKGNIRVYCRVRPFLPGQKEKKSIVEHAGENDLVVANPSKQGKDALRSFKFNRVFGPTTTQVEVYSDIQPFIRSVLDGYNVCIFAYGQTGSGKTYTMSGPNGATKETYGVNYRALNDLFSISESRRSSIIYEIGVQIVEIYNEQVRDLLSSNGTQKKLGISNHSQHKGLAVPDANMVPVKATSDVMDLMDIGLKNRASSATAMNERSSRSHSVVSIHVRGTDVKSGSSLYGNLHLVDLAGSERVDRSEVTGDRLKEAQHINKSLSALGDVIFALSQKGSHIPYRNSKLTQLLQSSLGGQAKTLMFVQVNPDANSASETLSTLKFAERVSGVELGAARSTKEGRDVRELMEQVASLKDTISEKDEEIERLQLLKDLKNSVTAS